SFFGLMAISSRLLVLQTAPQMDRETGPTAPPTVEVCGAASRTVDKAMRMPPRPPTPPRYRALLMIRSVECNTDEEKRDGKHKNASKDVHLYSFPISSMRRWIWRWSKNTPKP